jgi:alcohol dehydrogenase
MKAVVLAGVNDVRVLDVPDPVVSLPTDAVIRVTAAAICGADLFPIHGYTPGFENGTILGHETVGIVESVGSAVTSVAVGDRVVCTSMTTCGRCAHCLAGRPTQCLERSLYGYSGVYPKLDGGQAEMLRVPFADRCLRRIPAGVSDDAAIFVADILATAYQAVDRSDITVGDVAVVVGCGPLGQMAVLLARRLARTVIAVDGIAERRDLAARFGAQAVAPDAARAAIDEATGGLGADVVIEAAGSPGALTASLGFVRGRGTVSVIGAHFEPDYPLNNALMFEHEITLRFSIGNPTMDRDRLLGLIAAGEIDPVPVVSHRMPLADAAEAYRMFDAREATKVILLP